MLDMDVGTIHSGWVQSLHHCLWTSQGLTQNFNWFFPNSWLTNAVVMWLWWIHKPFHIACEAWQTPVICWTWMWEPFWVGLEPPPLHIGVNSSQGVTQNSNWFPNFWLTNAVEMWCWLINISPSTAYEACQTPCICWTWMWEPFWVGLEPPPLLWGNMLLTLFPSIPSYGEYIVFYLLGEQFEYLWTSISSLCGGIIYFMFFDKLRLIEIKCRLVAFGRKKNLIWTNWKLRTQCT